MKRAKVRETLEGLPLRPKEDNDLKATDVGGGIEGLVPRGRKDVICHAEDGACVIQTAWSKTKGRRLCGTGRATDLRARSRTKGRMGRHPQDKL